MRHASRVKRLSRTSEHYEATLNNMARNLVQHGRILTTLAKAKQAQPFMERLITLGKDGSVHARRQAVRWLKDRDTVKQLFSDIAPRFQECAGGYTRILKLGYRRGDGAAEALLELTRLPVESPKTPPKTKPHAAARPPEATPPSQSAQEPHKPKRFLEGLRELFRVKQGGGTS